MAGNTIRLVAFICSTSLLLVFLLPLQAEIKEIKSEDLVGTETLNFYLSSSEDRLIHYGDEYYGKHVLIITFFPAAFTPV
jgi:hypothetical protein